MMRFGSGIVLALGVACGPSGFEVVDVGDGRDLRALDLDGSSSGWIVGQAGALHRYTPDGVGVGTYTFEDDFGVRTPDLFAVALHRNLLWTAGDDGVITRHGPAGAATELAGTSARWLTLVEVTPRRLLAAGEASSARERIEGQWLDVEPAAAEARFTGSWAAGRQVALTTDTGLLVERDVTGRWTSQPVVTETSSVPVPLFDVWSSTVGADIFVVGLGGAIFRRPPDAATWEAMPAPATEDLYAIDGGGAGIYAVGAAGTVLRLDGGTWVREASATGRDLFDVHTRGPEVVAVGAGGTVVRKAD